MKKLLNIREPNVYARHVGAKELHPLISVVHFDELKDGVRTSLNNYSVYGLFIQREFPQNLSYGIRPVQAGNWSVIAVAPGQIGGKEDDGVALSLSGWAVLWSPELMSKTDLEAHISEYKFFSYFFTDSIPLDPQDWDAIDQLLSSLREELRTHSDSSALRNIIVGYLRLILDYCQRAYWPQSARSTAAEPDLLKRFHALLDRYYYEEQQT
ncbi:MAG: AraC family transcriptional regulator, partial [Paludibacteraceae bacterium]|nr:AraC family transcriptional regulator [Paludibacteraceae bacterium]